MAWAATTVRNNSNRNSRVTRYRTRIKNSCSADWVGASIIPPRLHPIHRRRLLSKVPVSIQDTTGHRGDFIWIQKNTKQPYLNQRHQERWSSAILSPCPQATSLYWKGYEKPQQLKVRFFRQATSAASGCMQSAATALMRSLQPSTSLSA